MFDTEHTAALAKIILEGLARSGQRAILSGFGKLDHLPETVFAVESIPHSWLFERVSAVCHHGGAGTSAAGFRAGVPSIILPLRVAINTPGPNALLTWGLARGRYRLKS